MLFNILPGNFSLFYLSFKIFLSARLVQFFGLTTMSVFLISPPEEAPTMQF